jgi:hypothetical protein
MMKSTLYNIARRASFDEVRPAQGANLDQESPGAAERQCKRRLIAVADLDRRGISEATASLARYFERIGRRPAPQAVPCNYSMNGVFRVSATLHGIAKRADRWTAESDDARETVAQAAPVADEAALDAELAQRRARERLGIG